MCFHCGCIPVNKYLRLERCIRDQIKIFYWTDVFHVIHLILSWKILILQYLYHVLMHFLSGIKIKFIDFLNNFITWPYQPIENLNTELKKDLKGDIQRPLSYTTWISCVRREITLIFLHVKEITKQGNHSFCIYLQCMFLCCM